MDRTQAMELIITEIMANEETAIQLSDWADELADELWEQDEHGRAFRLMQALKTLAMEEGE